MQQYFSDEQGIKIPDDDDGGFNDKYKPSKPTHPNFSSHFDHGGSFGPGVTESTNYPPHPLPTNSQPHFKFDLLLKKTISYHNYHSYT